MRILASELGDAFKLRNCDLRTTKDFIALGESAWKKLRQLAEDGDHIAVDNGEIGKLDRKLAQLIRTKDQVCLVLFGNNLQREFSKC